MKARPHNSLKLIPQNAPPPFNAANSDKTINAGPSNRRTLITRPPFIESFYEPNYSSIRLLSRFVCLNYRIKHVICRLPEYRTTSLAQKVYNLCLFDRNLDGKNLNINF